MAKITKEIIAAMDARKPFEKETLSDPARPKYHFASPCGLLIDVWGGIFHKGDYHLFYDNNYNQDPSRMGGGFCHLVSKDTVVWQEVPFALLPEEQRGENQLNDGFIVIDKNDKPLMYYTRCFADTTKNREHVAVRGSDDLLVWERINGGEAILTMENHGGPVFDMSWSDVVIFKEDGRTFMIISKCTVKGKGDMIPIYEATDDTLLKWEYKGEFANHSGEVINFIKIKDKWVLIYSPYNNPIYFVGSFDTKTCKFTAEKQGILSYGYLNQGWQLYDISRGFYATSSFYAKNGEVYIVGWISGFNGTKNWNGCVSLTRKLELDQNNNLLMKPIDDLNKLHKSEVNFKNNSADLGKSFELNVKADLNGTQNIKILIENSFELNVTNNHIKFNDIEFDFDLGENIDIKMYIDVNVAEIFFNNGRISISRCFKEIADGEEVKIKTDAVVKEIKGYKI